jgi:uncharacterized protein
MAASAPPIISDYDNGGFTIGDDFHEGSIIITGASDIGFAVDLWHVEVGDEMKARDLDAIYDAEERPMLILLGVGASVTHPFGKLRAEMSKRGIAVEILTTPAACRTWNLLLSEGRKVAMAAVAVPTGQLPQEAK